MVTMPLKDYSLSGVLPLPLCGSPRLDSGLCRVVDTSGKRSTHLYKEVPCWFEWIFPLVLPAYGAH
jgi:hypothetical protein